jgi:hypothetical protein
LSIALAFNVKMRRLFQKSWLAAGLLVAATVSASAQQTIVFSKPSDVSADKANSFIATPQRSANSKDFNAPHSVFKDYTPDNLGAPAPVIMNNQDPSVKEALEKRKNWTLLTPEQILGVQTPEQIMGVVKPDDKKNLSLEDQFIQRQNRTESSMASNRHPAAILWGEAANNPFEQRQQRDEYGNFSQPGERLPAGSGGRKNFNQLLDGVNSLNLPTVKPDSVWNSVFAAPDQPKPDLEQVAAMERFRAMMEPAAATPDKIETATRFAVPAMQVRDPNMQVLLPSFNPAGQSVAQLESGIGRPTGILPLSAVGRPAQNTTTKRPDWQAQLPPWMRSGPQSHNGNF